MARGLLIAALVMGACRGVDECRGEGTSWIEVGESGVDDSFSPFVDGEGLTSSVNDEGQEGVELGLRTRGADTFDSVTVTLELEVAGYLSQLVADTNLVCDNAGHGRLRVFGALPEVVQRDPAAHDGQQIYVQATVIDHRDRAIDGDPLLMELVTQ